MSNLLLSLFLLFNQSSNPILQFTVSPRWFYTYDGVDVGEVHYYAKLDRPGRVVCTGWVYPVLQWDKEDWPMRRSCRQERFAFVDERWGGKQHPLPLVGEYVAFIEVYEYGVAVETVTKPFTQFEGIPR